MKSEGQDHEVTTNACMIKWLLTQQWKGIDSSKFEFVENIP